MGVLTGTVEKSGAWYSYNGERIGQGRENVKVFFDEHIDIYNELYKKVQEELGLAKKEEASEGIEKK
jgi:recombination protein RecA